MLSNTEEFLASEDAKDMALKMELQRDFCSIFTAFVLPMEMEVISSFVACGLEWSELQMAARYHATVSEKYRRDADRLVTEMLKTLEKRAVIVPLAVLD